MFLADEADRCAWLVAGYSCVALDAYGDKRLKASTRRMIDGDLPLYYTKSSMLLDFRRGAQRVPPVCFGVLLGSAGQSASK